LNPAVILRDDSYNNVVFYIKGGVIIGLTNNGVYEDKYVYREAGKTALAIDDKTYYSGRMSYGGNLNFGLDFMLSEKFALFGEVSCRIIVWKPEKYTNIVVGTHEDGSTEVLTTGEKPATSSFFVDAIGLNVGVRYYLFKFKNFFADFPAKKLAY
jgi:hypothetical protein